MRRFSMKDLTTEQRETAEKNGIKYNTLVKRLAWGWGIKEAIGEKTQIKGGRRDNQQTNDDKTMSAYWFAGTNKGLKCPVEGCNHVGEVITKAHCRIVHGMEREQVRERYGMPIVVESKGEIVSHNNGRTKWYSVDTGLGVL